MERTLTTNLEKLRWHANAAERTQVKIEELEHQAEVIGARQQYGRMRRSDNTIMPDSYMAKNLLRDNHQYAQLVSSRNAHQAMIAMYSALIVAGVHETSYARHSENGNNFQLKTM